MIKIEITKQEDGTFNAIQAEPRLRDICGSGDSEPEAAARLFEYHAELVRNGSIRVDEVTS